MKKFLVIISVICIVFAFSACKSKEYVDIAVTVPVTDESGETVTDKSGNAVTEIVTDKNGNDVTQSVEKAQTKPNDIVVSEAVASVSQKSSDVSKNAESKSTKTAEVASSTAPKNNESKTEKTTKKKDSETTADKTTKKETTKKTSESTTKNTTEKATEKETTTTEPTTKSKRRDITVNVKLPYYNDIESELKISYRVVGDKKFKELDAEQIILDGKTIKTYVIERLKGDVEITVSMKGLSLTANTKTIAASDKDQSVDITPATGIEVMNGEDD